MDPLYDYVPFKDNWSYAVILLVGMAVIGGVTYVIPNKLTAGLTASFLTIIIGGSLVLLFQSYLLPDEKTQIFSWAKTLDMIPLSLIPIGFFMTGPIVDTINQQYKYSIPSVVSIFASAVVSLLGSKTLAGFSQWIIGKIYPGTGGVALGLVGNILAMINPWSVIAVLAVIVPPLAMNWTIGPSYAQGYSAILAAVYGIILIAGTGFLGIPPTADELASQAAARTARASALARALTPTTGPALGPQGQGNPFGGSKFKYDSDTDKCDVPGFTWLSNSLAPISVIITQTIIWCHLIESWDNSNSSNTIVLGVTALITFIFQATSLISNDCLATNYRYGNSSVGISLFVSILAAAVSYYGIKRMEGFTSDQSVQKSGVFSNTPPEAPPKPDGSVKIKVGSSSEKNLPVNDDDQFVCEAYKDGELVTSTIVS